MASQLGKKFENYKSRKTDSNQLLLHTLRKLVNEKVIFENFHMLFRLSMIDTLRDLMMVKEWKSRFQWINLNMKPETSLNIM